ncbi:MAG: carboxylate--amine ligase, partial [Candidatus Omnitrophica bacterium]|nr:carboxylate--amine ligase [Candidatus Omnitrophota bacterium]
MKRILITGAGGTPSTNFVRSLRKSGERFFIIGVDCDEYYLQRAETDIRYLVPKTSSTDYIPVLKDIIRKYKAELIYSQPDPEIAIISKYRDSLGIRTFLPADRTIEICQSKLASYNVWKEAGLKVPRTIRLNGAQDLKEAYSKFGKPVWLRAIVSYGGGKDSFYTSDLEVAKAWIRHCNGWGNFTASEYLSPDSVTWLSLWKDGELIVAQGRKRLYWEFGNRAPSGVTGLTGTGVTVSDPIVDKLAQKVIFAIDKKPNGIFAVDLTYDKKGVPNPTEINIGRFFTTHLFFTEAGLNLPYIFVKLAFGEKPPKIRKKVNPLPEGLAWVRGMDFLPILTNV